MILIRRFEERVLKLFEEGILSGTCHCCIGQEANAVGVINNLVKGDIVFSNHRCHGHYLALTDDVEGLLAELMGKKTGVVGGRGGSQHIGNGSFFANGIQAGLLPTAAGIAFAEKYKGSKNIVVAFIGDGTLGEGLAYEVFNIISLWKLPVLVVIENNRYAQSTPIEKNLAGDIKKRTEAFNIKTTEISTFDVREIFKESESIINHVRTNQHPAVIILNTYRFCNHSKSDDGRNQDEVKQWLVNDPLKILLKDVKDGIYREIEEKVNKRLRSAEDMARGAEVASLDNIDLDAAIEVS